jgi:hypothetical protein
MIAMSLNKSELLWAVGGSLMLHFCSLEDHPNDIDLFVSYEEVEQVVTLLKKLGTQVYTKEQGSYLTRGFYEFVINDVHIDVISGFRFQSEEGLFEYPFDALSVTSFHQLNNVVIPLISIEDWYILYQVIPDKQEKAAKIEEFFFQQGIMHPYLLQRLMEQPLPEIVRNKVAMLLSRLQR